MVLPPPVAVRKARKHLSADALYELLGKSFQEVPDHRRPNATIRLRDALLSAMGQAIFRPRRSTASPAWRRRIGRPAK